MGAGATELERREESPSVGRGLLDAPHGGPSGTPAPTRDAVPGGRALRAPTECGETDCRAVRAGLGPAPTWARNDRVSGNVVPGGRALRAPTGCTEMGNLWAGAGGGEEGMD